MTSPSDEPGAALIRSVLLGRAAVTVVAAAAALLTAGHPFRSGSVIAVVVVATVAGLGVVRIRPGLLRRTVAVLIADNTMLGAILLLDAGGAAFYLYAAGAAALAGVLAGRRAWPLWAVHAAIGFVAAARLLRVDGVPGQVAAFVVVFPMITVVAGLVAASFAAQAPAARPHRRPARAAASTPDPIEALSLDDPHEPFGAGVERMCREWASSSRTQIRVNADPVEPPLTTRHELTGILHEALRNVDQHADARRVDIWVRRAGTGVRLVIRDDGNGFSVPPDLTVLRAGNHFGVLSMAERARNIGADFIVRSAPSEGTLIEVLAPLAPSET